MIRKGFWEGFRVFLAAAAAAARRMQRRCMVERERERFKNEEVLEEGNGVGRVGRESAIGGAVQRYTYVYSVYMHGRSPRGLKMG